MKYAPLLREFVKQAQTLDQQSKKYALSESGIQVKASFGFGKPALVPWISFTKGEHTTSKGIYPVYLYYKRNNILILAYGISEDNYPGVTWPTDWGETIEDHFEENGLDPPDRYGSSLIFEIYDPKNLPTDEQLDQHLKTILTSYDRVLQNIEKKKATKNQDKFRLPTFTITEDEQLWLQTIYEGFQNDEPLNATHLLAPLWGKVADNFEPGSVSHVLAQQSVDITILGISCIDPGSVLIPLFEEVVYAIRDIIIEKGKVERISSREIIGIVWNITEKETYQIFKLLNTMGLANGYASSPDSSDVSISESHYKAYRNFKGLEAFLDEYIRIHANRNDGRFRKAHQLSENDIKRSQTISSRTQFTIRDAKDLKAVMGVLDLAYDLAEIIHAMPTEQEKGQMIGIFGKWGRGKTFLCSELWKALKEKKDIEYTNVGFQAWKYQETPASWAYLYENFADVFMSKSWWRRKNMLRLNVARHGYWPLIKYLIFILLSAAIGLCSVKMFNWYAGVTIMSVEIAVLFAVFKKFRKPFEIKAIDLIRTYGVRSSYKESLGLQAEIQKELVTLLKVWIPEKAIGKRKIILFVEDMDRCSEEKIIQNVDALRLLMEEEEIARRVIIVNAVDERVLKNAIRIKYTNLLKDPDTDFGELVSEYLDKLFILAVKLGALTGAQKKEFIRELIKKETDLEELEKYQLEQEEKKRAEQETDTASEEPQKPNDQDSARGRKQSDATTKTAVHPEPDAGSTPKEKNSEPVGSMEFRRLSPAEVIAFEIAADSLTQATPRKIRILYYRYLLSKNLLMNKYTREESANIWQSEEGIHALMKIILDYSNMHQPEQITQDKSKMVGSDEAIREIENLLGEKFRLSNRDYKILTDILELVIAY